MYHLYIGEIGYSSEANHHVMGGSIVNSKEMKRINDEITKLKKQYFETVYVDLKGLGNQKRKFFHNLGYNPFFEMELKEIEQFADKIFNILKNTNLTFLASIINKDEFYSKKRHYQTDIPDLYYISFKFLVEKFDLYLQEIQENGQIHIELDNQQLRENIENAHQQCQLLDNYGDKLVNLIDSCHIVYGDRNNFTQIAELFVNSVFKCIEYGKNECYDRYKNMIYSEKNNIRLGYGIQYYPSDILDIGSKYLDKL